MSKNPDSYPGKNTIVIDSDKNFPIEIVGGQKGWFWIRAINESNIFVKNGAQVGVCDNNLGLIINGEVIAGPDDEPTDAHLRAVLAALLGYDPETTD